MFSEERALLQLLREEPPALPAWAWERVQARLHEPARPAERFSLWLWWNRRLLVNARWAAAVAVVVMLALWTWWGGGGGSLSTHGDMLSSYAQVVSYAQSSIVDDPLNENTQIILSGWAK
ncbi:MAG: hypothetical protein NZ741_01805 [Armatimonadetes bacterium]|nr:hypothetical protein [Armatimonadota bacterium]